MKRRPSARGPYPLRTTPNKVNVVNIDDACLAPPLPLRTPTHRPRGDSPHARVRAGTCMSCARGGAITLYTGSPYRLRGPFIDGYLSTNCSAASPLARTGDAPPRSVPAPLRRGMCDAFLGLKVCGGEHDFYTLQPQKLSMTLYVHRCDPLDSSP